MIWQPPRRCDSCTAAISAGIVIRRPSPLTASRSLVLTVLAPLLMHAGFATAQGAPAPQASPFLARKAETLLRERLPCLGCYAFGEEGGRIAPDLRTVRQRRSAEYIARMIDDPQRSVPGSLMACTLMLPATRDAIVRSLQSMPGEGDAPPAASRVSRNTGADGKALYAFWCAPCHGSLGGGDGHNARFLPVKPAAHGTADAMKARPDDALYDTIYCGGAIMNRSARMPAFGETLSDAQVRALVAYIRELCACQGPAWSTR